ncbi:hypothetical protein SCHPADRAFT_504299 [Schizopora paradoxa]|uniref:Fungal-type protein kinase domain-containing protein n=1 Tax=Schizopora paradoxa TaxID=27342 RepID=A0A0H2RFS9_9AGAM|nr:hypothetical protein SCHPADRAFT_504299 [Schizopora paradoxa]
MVTFTRTHPSSTLTFRRELTPVIDNLCASLVRIAGQHDMHFREKPSQEVLEIVAEVSDGLKSSTTGSTRQPRQWAVRSASVAPDADDKILGGLVLVKAEQWERYSRGGRPIGWEHVDALCVTQASAHESQQTAQARLFELARTVFKAQPTRRFVLGMTFVGSSMTTYYAERQGIMKSDCFDIHADPKSLIRIVVATAFMEDEDIGR